MDSRGTTLLDRQNDDPLTTNSGKFFSTIGFP